MITNYKLYNMFLNEPLSFHTLLKFKSCTIHIKANVNIEIQEVCKCH